MTWPNPLFLIALTIAVANFILLSILFFKSSRWTGPGLNLRIERLEREEHIIRGNLTRVDRDLTAWHRATLDSNAEVLRELEAIRTSLNNKVSLRRSFDELSEEVESVKESVEHLRQRVGSLRCLDEAARPPKE